VSDPSNPNVVFNSLIYSGQYNTQFRPITNTPIITVEVDAGWTKTADAASDTYTNGAATITVTNGNDVTTDGVTISG